MANNERKEELLIIRIRWYAEWWKLTSTFSAQSERAKQPSRSVLWLQQAVTPDLSSATRFIFYRTRSVPMLWQDLTMPTGDVCRNTHSCRGVAFPSVFNQGWPSEVLLRRFVCCWCQVTRRDLDKMRMKETRNTYKILRENYIRVTNPETCEIEG